MRWVNDTLPPRLRRRWLLITVRLSARSLAGTARTLVAVGTVRLVSMLATTRAAAPLSGVVSAPTGAAAGRGVAVSAGTGAVAGAAVGAGAGAVVGAAGAGAAAAGAVVPLAVPLGGVVRSPASPG